MELQEPEITEYLIGTEYLTRYFLYIISEGRK